MPAALDVNREAVRLLAQDIGVREAARQLHLNENTVIAWSDRGQWFAKPKLPPTMLQPATGAIMPSEVRLNMDDRLKLKSRSLLGRYVLNGSKSAANSRSPLQDAPNVKALASVFATLWPDKQQAGVSIQMLSVGGGMG